MVEFTEHCIWKKIPLNFFITTYLPLKTRLGFRHFLNTIASLFIENAFRNSTELPYQFAQTCHFLYPKAWTNFSYNNYFCSTFENRWIVIFTIFDRYLVILTTVWRNTVYIILFTIYVAKDIKERHFVRQFAVPVSNLIVKVTTYMLQLMQIDNRAENCYVSCRFHKIMGR